MDGSALAKHTGLYHKDKDKAGDATIYSMTVNNTTNRCLLR